jgi:hypothetical protein
MHSNSTAHKEEDTMFKRVFQGLMIGSLLSSGACGAARVIHRDQVGGVIELDGDHGKAMEQANQEMSRQCGPNNFTILQEGEEAIGTDTIVTADESTESKTSKDGRKERTDNSAVAEKSTRTATAWRVHFQCGTTRGPATSSR